MPGGIEQMGKALLVMGLLIAAVGGLMMASGKLPWLGRLPGDIVIQRKNFTLYFPIATSIILSILLTLVLWFISRK
jgi:uncharacterized protein HemY